MWDFTGTCIVGKSSCVLLRGGNGRGEQELQGEKEKKHPVVRIEANPCTSYQKFTVEKTREDHVTSQCTK